MQQTELKKPNKANESISSSSFCVDSKTYAGKCSIGKKKKVKKQLSAESDPFLTYMKEENEKFKGMLLQFQDQLQKNYEFQLLNFQLAKQREENKILFIDLDSIRDPIVRDFIKNYQLKIVAKRGNNKLY